MPSQALGDRCFSQASRVLFTSTWCFYKHSTALFTSAGDFCLACAVTHAQQPAQSLDDNVATDEVKEVWVKILLWQRAVQGDAAYLVCLFILLRPKVDAEQLKAQRRLVQRRFFDEAVDPRRPRPHGDDISDHPGSVTDDRDLASCATVGPHSQGDDQHEGLPLRLGNRACQSCL